jgi:hypothetical protein
LCYSNIDFVQCYPLFGIGLLAIGVQILELKISWPNNGTDPISEWLEARDMAGTWCVDMAEYAMCFIIFTPALHLRSCRSS